MSGMRITIGYAVALTVPVDHETVQDYLAKKSSNLNVSYDGSVVFLDDRSSADETCGWWVLPPMIEFMHKVNEHHEHFKPDWQSIRPVVQHYYDGADDYFSELTAEKLRNKEHGI